MGLTLGMCIALQIPLCTPELFKALLLKNFLLSLLILKLLGRSAVCLILYSVPQEAMGSIYL